MTLPGWLCKVTLQDDFTTKSDFTKWLCKVTLQDDFMTLWLMTLQYDFFGRVTQFTPSNRLTCLLFALFLGYKPTTRKASQVKTLPEGTGLLRAKQAGLHSELWAKRAPAPSHTANNTAHTANKDKLSKTERPGPKPGAGQLACPLLPAYSAPPAYTPCSLLTVCLCCLPFAGCLLFAGSLTCACRLLTAPCLIGLLTAYMCSC